MSKVARSDFDDKIIVQRDYRKKGKKDTDRIIYLSVRSSTGTVSTHKLKGWACMSNCKQKLAAIQKCFKVTSLTRAASSDLLREKVTWGWPRWAPTMTSLGKLLERTYYNSFFIIHHQLTVRLYWMLVIPRMVCTSFTHRSIQTA